MKTVAFITRSSLALALGAALSALGAGYALGESRPHIPAAWSAFELPPIPEINTMPWLDGWSRTAAPAVAACVPPATANQVSVPRNAPSIGSVGTAQRAS